ncbi:hypothetical protein [Hyphomicrobium sp. D-2]|uniref:hypothetical protein n=1 Tax=Hyphomicrobium sp. D-2 TaxID=3041621 RepID=UPI002458B626|nr:hypothetical protein [Hyphomicrobium sp. D-2]MDH4980843.1 hypothetical protein [Hyphomicrobium sp. D-2]
MRETTSEDQRDEALPVPAVSWVFHPLPAEPRRPSLWKVTAAALVSVVGGSLIWQGAKHSPSAVATAEDESAFAEMVLPADEILMTGSLPTIHQVSPNACTSLELDRATNRTLRRPCPPDGLALRLEADRQREDAVLASGYTILNNGE